ncbi:hypothetical protein [Faecalibaculum rodentium]|uniref:hypothetical protein n=1 Tax=Faecalibaculum rodentium TaxID=1702221 RepID=UPI0023F23C50|nr:hypothetical protein [Faecalibaculum rodentium]
MNDEKRPGELDQDSQDDLDAFARALLNRKTEMRIFRDETGDEVEIGFSDNEREAAEKTMSQALDTLRKSRGQKTIEEEETAFWFEEEPETGKGSEEPASPAPRKFREPHPVRKTRKPRKAEETKSSRPESGSSRKPRKKSAAGKKQTDSKRTGTDAKPKTSIGSRTEKRRAADKQDPAVQSARPQKKPASRRPHDPARRRIVLAILALCLLAAAGLGVYCWKVLVWNPENLTTEVQEASFRKLVDYADEYGSGLMSDAEQAEILDLKADYDSLAPRQKKEIDAYFAEQTRSGDYPNGRTFEEIWQEQTEKKQAAEDAAQPQFQELTSFLANWNDKSDQEKRQIVNYRDFYKGLTQSLKTQVDDQLRAATGQTFSQLVSEQEEAMRSEQVAHQEQVDARKAELQAQIDALNQELQTYIQYGTSLSEELNAATVAGQDTSEIEAQITANNAYVQELSGQISSLEYQRDSLQ